MTSECREIEDALRKISERCDPEDTLEDSEKGYKLVISSLYFVYEMEVYGHFQEIPYTLKK